MSKKFLIISILLISCIGCGEIHHYRTLEPIATDQWKISKGEWENGEISVAEQVTNHFTIKVKVPPLINDQISVGPIIPIIPNPMDNDESQEKKILVQLSIDHLPPKGLERANGIKLKIGDNYLSPSNVETFIYIESVMYRVYFNNPGVTDSLELILPEFGFGNQLTPIKYVLHDDTNYKVLAPIGMFQ